MIPGYKPGTGSTGNLGGQGGMAEIDGGDGPAAEARLPAMTQRLPAVTRFEVIDHTRAGSGGKVTYHPQYVRSVLALGVSVELSVQDDGATLKVFLR